MSAQTHDVVTTSPGAVRGGAATLWAAAKSAIARLGRHFTLFQRFMVLSLLILLVGAYVIGSFVSGEIEDRVISRTASITALYVDSVVSPHLQELAVGHDISADHLEELDHLLVDSALGERIAEFKVWHSDGDIVYAENAALVGRRFPIADDLSAALQGHIETEMSDLSADENVYERDFWDNLLETYSPIRQDGTGEIIGVVEFYQDPSDLQSEIAASQRKGWLIVGGATAVMYGLLVGMVGGASTTIRRQHGRLERLANENASLAASVKRAASRKTETDELLLRRIAQDLHDGPAQDVSLALLRLDSVGAERDAGRLASGEVELMRTALGSALKEIREICSGLRLPELDALDLKEVIRRAVQDHRDKSGHTVRLTVCGHVPAVDMPTKIALYRVTQEALNNAYRHSGTSEQDVRLGLEEGGLALVVEDRGRGIAPAPGQSLPGGGLGIRGMRERVEMLGGRLHVSSVPGAGTTVTAVVPVGGG